MSYPPLSYQIAVRALCEFTAKSGDLDLRFTPSPTAQEGIAGHGLVASRRPEGYQAELSLSGDYESLRVRGRADGYDPARNQLEEIKTYRGDLSLMPANHRQLHWAQVKVYGWLLCQQRGLGEVRLALVYFDVVSQQETCLSEWYPAAELEDFFVRQCRLFLAWAEQELAHRQRRDGALQTLRFPHGDFRQGQRSLAEAVYKSVSVGCCLLAQAPTGIGKTMGTLFPLLKAMPLQQLDRVFYLTAKTPGRRLALDALETLSSSAASRPLRVLELVARDKACEYPDRACNGDACPLAKGFYDRLPTARQAAMSRGQGAQLDQQAVRDIALEHSVCPYYLSQELARWCDVVVGDYNYYFDASAMLYGLTVANQWRISVLVDEAHNLVERARSMYTAELTQGALQTLRRSAPAGLKTPLDRVNRQWNALNRGQEPVYQAYETPPTKLLSALQTAVAAMADWLAEPSDDLLAETGQGLSGPLLRFYFDALQFCRLAALIEAAGAPPPGHFLFDVSKTPRRPGQAGRRAAQSTLCVRNLVPASLLQPRFDAARACVLFSATLSPRRYYTDLLGLPKRTSWIDVESPFGASQLRVQVIDQVSTRFADRGASIAPIAALIAGQLESRPGNYLAFFSSFDYLDQVLAYFRERYPAIAAVAQSRRMDEPARQAFLAHFAVAGRQVGFVVLGGAFAEGIDLPGERLIGAFIATLGLPQINPVNEQLKERMGAVFGAGVGYDYSYFYPGLQKVVQAAGRVIRTPADRGVVYLIDDRFAQPRVQRLLPCWWDLDSSA